MSLLLFQDLTNSLSLHHNTWFAHTFIEFIQQTVWEHLDPAQCFNNDLDVIGDKASWSETTEKYWPSLWSIYYNILSWETGHTVRSQGVYRRLRFSQVKTVLRTSSKVNSQSPLHFPTVLVMMMSACGEKRTAQIYWQHLACWKAAWHEY